MRKIHLYLLLCFTMFANAQNKELLYGFNGLPQAQLLNPSQEMPYRMHIGFPALSNIHAAFGTTNFALEDLFLPDHIPFRVKVDRLIAKTKNTDYMSINQRLELLNFGFAKDEDTYFSGGWYEEFDFISYMPKDMMDLVYYGNHPYPDRIFKASDINFKMELLGVLHFGVSKKINDNFRIGGRFKIYSSVLNVNSTHNEGTFTTIQGSNNIHTHLLSDANISIKTAGFATDKAPNIGSFLLGGSKGFGVDFGLTWHPSEQWTVTTSLIDLGVIFNKKDVKQYNVTGSYTFTGFDLLYPGTSPNDYWGEMEDQIDARIITEDTATAYTTWRSSKIYSSVAYSFGQRRSGKCNCLVAGSGYMNEVGVQTFNIFRPKRPQYALTAYFKHQFGSFLTAKVAYTYDEYNPTNLGLGLSLKLGAVNIYATMDNMLELQDLTKSKAVSAMFGINILLKKRELY